MKIIDGCNAAAYIAYALSDVAEIYPISPASVMGELADVWSSQGRKNLMGQPMVVHEMQSEAGASGAVHGCLVGGVLTTTFTASQGLLLMIPNMYKIAGELLPAVFHVTTRSLSTHALSIFGDHQDVMACRQTGFAFLASASVQECMDLGLVAHLSAIEGSIPFCHFFDGWRTGSEMQTIHFIDYEDIRGLVNWDKVNEFRNRAMNPEHPDIRGTAQNPDIYFQNREAANLLYNALPDIVERNMCKVSKLTGRTYNLFDYVGHEEAEYIVVAMCSSCNVIEEVVGALVASGEKVGLVKVRLYRPFSVQHFLDAMPETVKAICALDRTKEPGAQGEPLYQDVCTALRSHDKLLRIIGGRYGLSSKDFTPSMVKAIFEHMRTDCPKPIFTIGINDDVSGLSLPVKEEIETIPEGTTQCRFYGFGSDGTVGANKQAAYIIGNNTDLYVQAFFSYDSKKSGGYTISDLRFGKKPVNSSYLIEKADYIACHKDSYVRRFDVLEGIKEKGVFVLNSAWSLEDMEKELPARMRRVIAAKQLKFYNIDAVKIAETVGLGGCINMIMETVFFKLAGILDFTKAVSLLKADIKNIYAIKGEAVVEKNLQAVDMVVDALVEISYPVSWEDAQDPVSEKINLPDFITCIAEPILTLKGNDIPVSKLSPGGIAPVGTTGYEKRGIAISIPEWDVDKCIECCQCSFVCPHAAIRPILATEDELQQATALFVCKKAVHEPALQNLSFRIQVYPDDCLGCGSCVDVCPAGALTLKPWAEQRVEQAANLLFAQSHISVKDNLLARNTVKGSQLQQPLFEFSGACAGCGETPYIKLITQLFGERLIIANATGCSSIYGASMPSFPYTVNKDGKGPAWGNSLFEDAAEYGYGIATAVKLRRDKLELLIDEALVQKDISSELQNAFNTWKMNKMDSLRSFTSGKEIIDLLGREPENPLLDEIKNNADQFGKKSIWIVGGDGWAYDIGFGGLDHVLASGENINILVLDTECYSNTGGQMSKATPLGAITKFASAGKRSNRKNLGRMLMTYDNVYVASIALGANKQQAINAFVEAEAYDGPSIVIAYCPCINHGIRKGMGTSIHEEAHAVSSGYWPLYRFNPTLISQGQSPFILDYKKPDGTMPAFLNGENRYAFLMEKSPVEAKILWAKLQNECDKTYQNFAENDID